MTPNETQIRALDEAQASAGQAHLRRESGEAASAGVFARFFRPSNFVRSAALPLLTALLAAATFIIDTVTPYEIAAATFYVVVVLLSVRFARRRGVTLVSGTCVVLTIVSYTLTQDGNFETGIINTSISLIAIAATTYLALKMESAREAAEQAQGRLAHMARVTTLGELAASIAHEVNQPLAGIVTNANAFTRWTRAQPPNMEKAASSIDSIIEDANRASDIIARIRTLATRAEPHKAWTDINGVIQQVLTLMQNQFRENRIVLRTNLADDLPMIFGDSVQLQQVVLNLAVNAIDAISAKGRGAREIRVSSWNSRPFEVAVAVEDSGIGIDAAFAGRLFEPFHSTKNGGMGMGLAICRTIIEAHNGRIRATPGAEGGTVFQFTLPIGRERTS